MRASRRQRAGERWNACPVPPVLDGCNGTRRVSTVHFRAVRRCYNPVWRGCPGCLGAEPPPRYALAPNVRARASIRGFVLRLGSLPAPASRWGADEDRSPGPGGPRAAAPGCSTTSPTTSPSIRAPAAGRAGARRAQHRRRGDLEGARPGGGRLRRQAAGQRAAEGRRAGHQPAAPQGARLLHPGLLPGRRGGGAARPPAAGGGAAGLLREAPARGLLLRRRAGPPAGDAGGGCLSPASATSSSSRRRRPGSCRARSGPGSSSRT